MHKNRFQKKRQQTREKIYRAAIDLFLEKGYEKTTVQEIVDRADVAKGTFFNHFPTKDSLLSYLGEQRVAEMEDVLHHTLNEKTTAKVKLKSLLQTLGKINEENRILTELLSKEIFKRLLTPGMEREKNNQLKLKEIFNDILISGQQNGEFQHVLNAEQVSDTLIGIYFFTLFQWLEKPEMGFSGELLDRFDILMSGIETN